MSYMFVPNFEAIGHVTLVLEPENRPASLALKAVSVKNGFKYQRWSRGHKARGQGQRHKKNARPRPRTALPRTEPLEAKDRNARGQGQGPRTQAQVF